MGDGAEGWRSLVTFSSEINVIIALRNSQKEVSYGMANRQEGTNCYRFEIDS